MRNYKAVLNGEVIASASTESNLSFRVWSYAKKLGLKLSEVHSKMDVVCTE